MFSLREVYILGGCRAKTSHRHSKQLSTRLVVIGRDGTSIWHVFLPDTEPRCYSHLTCNVEAHSLTWSVALFCLVPMFAILISRMCGLCWLSFFRSTSRAFFWSSSLRRFEGFRTCMAGSHRKAGTHVQGVGTGSYRLALELELKVALGPGLLLIGWDGRAILPILPWSQHATFHVEISLQP